MSAARNPQRALLAVAAASALLLAAGLLPAFSGAAPAGDLASEVGRIADPAGPAFAGGAETDGDLGESGVLVDGAGDGSGDSPESIREVFDDGDGRGDGNESDGDWQCGPTNGYRVCLPARPLTPGQVVPVTVHRDGEPAADVPVRVNGEAVGRTDDRGRVGVPVPYADEIRIAVGGPNGAPALREDRAYALARQDDGVTLPVRTDIKLVVESTDPDPGERASVRATVGGTPAPGMSVSVDGTAVGETGSDGRATVTLPEATGTTVRVERGEVAAERTVTLFDPTVRTKGLVAFPGETVDLVATEGGEPVAGGTVAVGGAEHRLDGNGRVSAALPIAPTADLVVRSDGATATLTKQLWLAPVGAVSLVLGVPVAVGLLFRRATAIDRSLVAQAVATLSTVASGLLPGLIGFAASAADATRAVAARLRNPLAAVEAPDFTPAADLLSRIAALLAFYDLQSRLARLWARVAGTDGDAARDAASGPGGSRGRVEAAWAAFVDRVGVDRPSRRTPGEVAEAALTAGFPRPPVERLTEAFRAVEYADADPDEHAETAERAASEMEGER